MLTISKRVNNGARNGINLPSQLATLDQTHMAVHGLVATSVIEENAAIKKRIGEETANLNKDGETLLLVGCSTGIVVAHELLCHETSRF